MSLAFSRVLLHHPLTIAAAGYVAYPVLVFKIPVHGLGDSALECLPGVPVQFTSDFSCVHGVAAIVTRAILDERNQLPMWDNCVVGPKFVKQAAERLDDI